MILVVKGKNRYIPYPSYRLTRGACVFVIGNVFARCIASRDHDYEVRYVDFCFANPEKADIRFDVFVESYIPAVVL